MSIRRRWIVLALPALLGLPACSTPPPQAPEQPSEPLPEEPSGAAQPQPLLDDEVAVYLVPLDDFSQALAANLSQGLQRALGIRIESTAPLPPLRLTTVPGTQQYESEALLVAGRVAATSLALVPAAAYCLFLTARPINKATDRARHQFSAHNRGLDSSVVSLAGLLEPGPERPVFSQRTALRLFKMSKRAIGEMHLGWSRSTDPLDLMYSPILSLEDVDRIGSEHAPQPAEASQ